MRAPSKLDMPVFTTERITESLLTGFKHGIGPTRYYTVAWQHAYNS